MTGPSARESLCGKISRREMLGIIAAAGGSALLSACGVSSEKTATPEAFAGFSGYSIFDETMVDMAWPEIEQAAKAEAIVFLPVGTIEEHGPHMALAADIYATYNWAKLARRAFEAKGTRALVAPPMYWGISPEVQKYPGTFSVSETTLKSLIYDIHECLHRWGFHYIFSMNNHGSSAHNRVYQQAVITARDTLKMGAYYVYADGAEVIDRNCAVFLKDVTIPEGMKPYLDVHAGAHETATMTAFFPNSVNKQLAKTLKRTYGFDPQGYYGDPASFDQIAWEDIQAWVDSIIAATVRGIEEAIGYPR